MKKPEKLSKTTNFIMWKSRQQQIRIFYLSTFEIKLWKGRWSEWRRNAPKLHCGHLQKNVEINHRYIFCFSVQWAPMGFTQTHPLQLVYFELFKHNRD